MSKQLNITYAPLLENLIEMRFSDGEVLDLHNDFFCEYIKYESGQLLFRFQSSCSIAGTTKYVIVEFSNATITELTLDGGFSSEEISLDTLERIKCETINGLGDVFPDGRVAFLAQFFPSGSFEIKTKCVIITRN